MSDKQLRYRVVIRDISNPELVAFQIKVLSEVAATKLGKHGEFMPVDRIPRDLEPLIQELHNEVPLPRHRPRPSNQEPQGQRKRQYHNKCRV